MEKILSRKKKKRLGKNLAFLLSSFLAKVFVFFIVFYQKFLSPHLLPSCRHLPTCSEYAREAFRKKGVVKGFFLTCRRLASCHPFAKSKVDEVP